jgi:hypothetical protein
VARGEHGVDVTPVPSIVGRARKLEILPRHVRQLCVNPAPDPTQASYWLLIKAPLLGDSLESWSACPFAR